MLAKGWGHESTIISLINWTFLFGTPSECPPPTRQRVGDELSLGNRLERKAATGVAARDLVVKLNRRKQAVAGSKMARVRMCGKYATEL